MHPAVVAQRSLDAAVGGKFFHILHGFLPFSHHPPLVFLHHIVQPVRGQAVDQIDSEQFLVAGVGIKAAAFAVDFKNTEMNGLGDEPEAFFALLEGFLCLAGQLLFDFKLVNALDEFDYGALVGHINRFPTVIRIQSRSGLHCISMSVTLRQDILPAPLMIAAGPGSLSRACYGKQ